MNHHSRVVYCSLKWKVNVSGFGSLKKADNFGYIFAVSAVPKWARQLHAFRNVILAVGGGITLEFRAISDTRTAQELIKRPPYCGMLLYVLYS